MRIFTRFRVINFVISLVFSLSSAQPVIADSFHDGQAFQNGQISSAFSDSTPLPEYEDAATGYNAKDVDDKILDLTSFPSRAVVGEVDDSTWEPGTALSKVPQSARLRLRFGTCVVMLTTARFTISSHRFEEGAGYPVKLDAVQENTTFNVDEEFFVSVGTELDIVIPSDYLKACQKRFGGKRVAIGRGSLLRSMLTMVSDKETLLMNQVLKAPSEYMIINWTNEGARPGLENESGFPVVLESGVYSMPKNTSDGVYFLNLVPRISTSR